MTTDVVFMELLEKKLDAFYRDFQQYGEMPPGDRLRLEGFMECGIALGLADHALIQAGITRAYERYMGEAPPNLGWLQAGAPVLHVKWERAPVYPST